MDKRTLEILEYPKIIALLSEHCASVLGREIICRMQPLRDMHIVFMRLNETTEARQLLTDHAGLSARGLHDVRDAITRAKKIGVLSAQELLDIAESAACCRRMRHGIVNTGSEYPMLSQQGKLIADFLPIEKGVDAAIAPSGEIHDNASSELARARRRTRALYSEIQGELQRLIHSPSTTEQLQEAIITQRNGRFCVPVRAESRHAFKGIMHDISASGQTAFMEPLSVMHLGNDLREAQRVEEEEVQRVLAALSALVGKYADAFMQAIEAVARLDAIFARASFARALDATQPELNVDGRIILQQARHPLLGDEAVPIDIQLGEEGITTLLITGPNTGGKTVTLKTAGLLTLMAQSGLHVPAYPGAQVAVFDEVFADIGDEQSIEQSLSTFSGHMRNIIAIVKQAGPNSLILLDEVGAGTDPAEGAALAKAVLLELQERGCRTIATTHYGELKVFGHNTPGFINASVEFDMDTLRPTYRVLYGLPGSSNALAISQRLGLPKSIVTRARAQMPEAPQAMEQVLKQAEGVRRALDRERTGASVARKEAELLAATLRVQQQQIDEKRAETLARARQQAQEIIEKTRRDANALLEELKSALREMRGPVSTTPIPRPRVADIRRQTRETLTQIEDPLSELPLPHAQNDLTRSEEKPVLTRVEAGQTVYVRSLGHRGVALAAASGDDEVDVQVGIMRVKVPVSDLESRVETTYPVPPPPGTPTAVTVEREIHLLGKRAEEAEQELDSYLYAALDNGLHAVRIVHGFGTGALRQVVQKLLRHHPAVLTYRSGQPQEGGGGVTIAELSNSRTAETLK